MNNKIPIHQTNIESCKELILSSKISEQDKKDILIFINDLSLGKVNKGFKISESRQAKYLYLLKIPLEFFKKPTAKLILKDVENFEKALSSDKIKSSRGSPFNDSTKADIRKALRTYLKWKLGPKAVPLTDWFDTRVPRKTPEYLSEQEIEKLYKNCKNASERFLIAVLFDSGARAEEFHNIRFQDIQLPKDKDNFVKLTLKEEYSKTKGRVISLYWKYTLEAVNEYLEEIKKDGILLDQPIYKNKYDNARQILSRLGNKVLNKNIHYHLFRHSSATFYAPKMNRQELCYRYGWAFSSEMPDIYISRAGMENKQLDEKFTNTGLGELQSQLNKEEFERKKLLERLDDFEKKDKEREERREQAFKMIERMERDRSNELPKEELEYFNKIQQTIPKKLKDQGWTVVMQQVPPIYKRTKK
jgi:integrase